MAFETFETESKDQTNETKEQAARRRYLLESTALQRPHPLRNLADRLGRSPGRAPLPDLFEQYLRDQISRPNVPPPSRSALLPSRRVRRSTRRAWARRPDC